MFNLRMIILTIVIKIDEVAMIVINWKNDYKNVAFNSFCILLGLIN